MVNRKELFSEWNDVCIRKQKDGTYICYECKLYDNTPDIHFSGVYAAVGHVKAHTDEGHKLWPFVIKDLHLAKEIQDKCVSEVKIHYVITNNGDGSASVRFFKTEEDAIKFDEYETEHYDGFAEPEYFTEKLFFDKDGIMINGETFEEATKEE